MGDQAKLFERPFERLACSDCVEWLRTIDDETIDLVLTDPAYESLEKHRAVGTTTRLKQSDGSSNKWFPIFKNERFPELFREIYRVLKPDTHFYMYCDQETMFVAKPMAEAAGFTFWKPLIWNKVSIGLGYHYRAQYEVILFLEKGHRNLNDRGIPDILTSKRVHGRYPTEKPVDVSRTLIEQSTQPGELVVDVFMGSGSVGEAALRAGRQFAGCEIDREAFENVLKRLNVGAPS